MALTNTWLGANDLWTNATAWSGGVTPGGAITNVILFDGSNTFASVFNSSLNHRPDQLIVTDPNATITWADGKSLRITSFGTSGVQQSAGTIIVSSGNAFVSVLQMNTGTIGGVFNIGGTAEVDVLNSGTLTLVSGGNIHLTGGELDIGHATALNGSSPSGFSYPAGLVYIDGGVDLITGGTVLANALISDNGARYNAYSFYYNYTTYHHPTLVANTGVFKQTGGLVDITGIASFTAGTASVAGNALLEAGTVVIGTNFAINGGTVAALSGGAGITIVATDTVTMGTGATTATLDGTFGGITNAGVIMGQGAIKGDIAGAGSIIASGGVLDVIASQSGGDIFNIDTIAASEVKFDGSSDTGGTVVFNAASIGVLGLGNAAALTGFTDGVSGLGIASSATSVAGDNFINVNSAVTIGDIKVVGGTNNQFATGNTQFILYTDMTDTNAVGTITLASAPVAGTFVVWRPDATANGGALGGTDVFLANMVCYAAGTLIRTDRGDVAVEDLAAGDTVVTLQNGQEVSMAIKWMGVRQLDIAKHPHPHLAAPVRIRAGAFGDDLPRRDLLVSPAHAILVGGKLVPANLLINNMTIVQDTSIKAITYHHIELDRHAIVLAEGLPAESYLDVGNRDFFSNAGLPTALHPEFHANAGLKVWEEKGCAPLAIDAEDVAPIWRTLADRAESLGYTPPRFTTTHDADLYVEANGRRLRPVAVAKGKHTFMLPAGASDIVLHSRTAAPGDLDPLTGDWRALGVAVRSLTVRSGDDHLVIPADHPALAQGWHTPETGNGSIWRWTNGNAAIPMVSTAGPVMLDIDVAEMGTYILARSDRDEQRLAA
jgi:hypothetical protein